MIVINKVSKQFKLNRKQRKELGRLSADKWIKSVDNVSLTCQPGRVFTLLGPNGAGKTTLLRMVATLLLPDQGSIAVSQFDTAKQGHMVRKKIGFLTGTTKLYERLTPNELIQYYARLNQMDTAIFKSRKKELFEFLGIDLFENQRIGKLSMGMKQKVSIVRTIIHDPDIMVFDEPTAGLDVISARHIIQLINSCKKHQKTIIFSTHIMSEVNLLSDDLAIMHQGRILYNGTYQAFKESMTEKTLEDQFIQLVQGAKP